MGYKIGARYSIGLCEATHKALTRLKNREKKRLGLRRFSWDDFLSRLAMQTNGANGEKQP